MPTIPLGTADIIEIEGGEEGFELYLETQSGVRYVFNIHACAPMLLKAVIEEIVPWWEEREAARLSRPVTGPTGSLGPYPDDDPKNADWHSVHADRYDSREGK